MKKIKLIIAALAVLTLGISAVSANPNDYHNAVGIFAITDFEENAVGGIQFQKWVTDKIGFQIEGSIFYNADTYKSFSANFNAEMQYKLFQTNMGEKNASVLYAWVLAGGKGNSTDWYDESAGKRVNGETLFNATLGLGFGFDFNFINHLSVPIQFGFMGTFPNTLAAGFAIGTGVRYRF